MSLLSCIFGEKQTTDETKDDRLPEGVKYDWYYCESMDSNGFYEIHDIENYRTKVTYRGKSREFFWRKDGKYPDENRGMELGGFAYDRWRESLWSLKRDGAKNKEEYDNEISHRHSVIKEWKDRIDRRISEDNARYRNPNARPEIMRDHV